MIRIDRRSLRAFDWISCAIMIALNIIGLVFVFSSTYQPENPYSMFFKKQLTGAIGGLIIFGVFCAIDYRRLQRWGYFGYFILIALLAFTLIKGKVGLGGRRWINLGLFTMQPSEVVKLLFPAFFSYYLLGERHRTAASFAALVVILCGTMLLVIRQPDLGTGILIGISGMLMLLHANIGHRFFVALTALGIIASPLIWKSLRPYQQQRVLVFLGKGDARRERYQIEQSYIAIGSGGVAGKGLLKGTQNMLQFLPESHNDFIFAVVGEEWGFIGTCLIVLLYALLCWRILRVIRSMQDPNAQLLALGLTTPIMSAAYLNMLMVLGLCPVVGIPLPLISYGVTNLWITYASLGWYQGIAMRRDYYNAAHAS